MHYKGYKQVNQGANSEFGCRSKLWVIKKPSTPLKESAMWPTCDQITKDQHEAFKVINNWLHNICFMPKAPSYKLAYSKKTRCWSQDSVMHVWSL